MVHEPRAISSREAEVPAEVTIFAVLSQGMSAGEACANLSQTSLRIYVLTVYGDRKKVTKSLPSIASSHVHTSKIYRNEFWTQQLLATKVARVCLEIPTAYSYPT